MPMLSVGVAWRLNSLLTVEPAVGEMTLTAGGVVSAGAAAATALAAFTRPKPVVVSKLLPSPAVASMIPLTWVAVKAGLRDSTRAAMPETEGVAIDVP